MSSPFACPLRTEVCSDPQRSHVGASLTLDTKNFISCINVNVRIDTSIAQHVCIALLRCRTYINNNKQRNLIQGNLQLAMQKISLRGLPAWRKHPCVDTHVCQHAYTYTHTSSAPPNRTQPHTSIVLCPYCRCPRDVAGKRLFNAQSATLLTC